MGSSGSEEGKLEDEALGDDDDDAGSDSKKKKKKEKKEKKKKDKKRARGDEDSDVEAPIEAPPPGPLKKQRFPFQLSPSRRQQNVINLRVIKIFSDKLLGLTNPRRTKLLHGTLLHIGHLSDKTLKKNYLLLHP